MAIDIGADAIDRAYASANAVYKLCMIEGSNPATVAGTVRKVYIYMELSVDCNPVYIGTFTHEGSNVFSSRDYESVGALVAGLNEKEVSLDVEIGDYIGLLIPKLATGNGIDLDYNAGWTNDYWVAYEDTNFPYASYTFTNLGKRIISLYGELGVGPTVTTQAVTAISGTIATGNGNVTDLGDTSVTQHGHCWNTTGTPTTAADSKTTNGAAAATGAFTSAITGLTSATKYYVRAYATNSDGTSYGEQVIFIAGAPGPGEGAGVYAVVEERFHYVDAYGVERCVQGTVVV